MAPRFLSLWIYCLTKLPWAEVPFINATCGFKANNSRFFFFSGTILFKTRWHVRNPWCWKNIKWTPLPGIWVSPLKTIVQGGESTGLCARMGIVLYKRSADSTVRHYNLRSKSSLINGEIWAPWVIENSHWYLKSLTSRLIGIGSRRIKVK